LQQQTPGWSLRQKPPDTLQKWSHNFGAVGQYVQTKQCFPGGNTTSPATIISTPLEILYNIFENHLPLQIHLVYMFIKYMVPKTEIKNIYIPKVTVIFTIKFSLKTQQS